MRVVLDTNIFVAGYFNKRSASARIIDLASDGKIEVAFSKIILKELSLILRNISANQGYRDRIDDLVRMSKIVSPRRHFHLIKEDPEDNKFLDIAHAFGADYLITADRHLLGFKVHGKTRIIKPVEFSSLVNQ
jgi:putative PIN family toxin of toxin-antitoxin system